MLGLTFGDRFSACMSHDLSREANLIERFGLRPFKSIYSLVARAPRSPTPATHRPGSWPRRRAAVSNDADGHACFTTQLERIGDAHGLAADRHTIGKILARAEGAGCLGQKAYFESDHWEAELSSVQLAVAHLNLKLSRLSWLTDRQPISFMSRSISARRFSSALSTPA
jgi:hypothetical protein